MKSFDQVAKRRVEIVAKSQRYAAFGSELLLLPDGTLLCSYRGVDFDRDVYQKVIIASTDRGRTWAAPRIVEERPARKEATRADSLTRLSDGRIAMIGNACVGSDMDSGFEIRWSNDDGLTWTKPVIAGTGTIPWCNHIIETAGDGLLVTSRAPTNVEPVKKVVMQYVSRDRGRSWQGPRVIAENPYLKLTEPSTIRLKDGRLMTVIRENSYNIFPSYRIFSDDDGETWSDLQELPIFGHEQYLGQLQSGKIMVAYRHVGGYAATLAWIGEADELIGFQVPATIRAGTSPQVRDGVLRVLTSGKQETVLYHLHPPESDRSTIRLQAELRCVANQRNACAIHVAQAGWVAFYPDRVELPECGGTAAPIDAKEFHRYEILRSAEEVTVLADGRELLRTDRLARGEATPSSQGNTYFKNVNAFGTQNPFHADPDAESQGEAYWRSVKIEITNPHLPDHRYEWDASSGKLPNWYEQDRIIELENNYGGSIYHVGQVAWVQFSDGEIFMVTGRQYVRPDGKRSSWMRGCILHEADF